MLAINNQFLGGLRNKPATKITKSLQEKYNVLKKSFEWLVDTIKIDFRIHLRSNSSITEKGKN